MESDESTMSQNAVVSCNRRLLAPAIARTRLNIHLRSEDFVRIVLRGVFHVSNGFSRNWTHRPSVTVGAMRILTPYAAAFAGYEQKETEMVYIVVQREAARTNLPPIGRGLSESHPVRPLIRFRSKTHDGMVKHRRPESKT